MGWWGEGIMHGDGPMDIEIELKEYIGLSFDIELKKEHLIHIDSIIELSIDKLKKNNDPMYLEVLGHMIITTGADMPDNLRKIITRAASLDEWALSEFRASHSLSEFKRYVKDIERDPRTALNYDDSLRQGVINDFITHIESYRDGEMYHSVENGEYKLNEIDNPLSF